LLEQNQINLNLLSNPVFFGEKYFMKDLVPVDRSSYTSKQCQV